MPKLCSTVFVQAEVFSLCGAFPADPDNSPRCDLCSSEPDTAVATLRTHTTELDLFQCAPPPALHLHIASFLPDFPLLWSCFDCVLWWACKLQECWMWWWTATACVLNKMCVGRRRFWVMSEKCQGVLWMSFSSIFSSCFDFYSTDLVFWSQLWLSLQISLSQKLHLFLYPLHMCLLLSIFSPSVSP